MPNREHQDAQELSSRAELALRAGNRAAAKGLYAEAAEMERIAFELLPRDRPRTRGILAVSYVALLFKAAEYDRVESAVCRILPTLLDPTFRDQLKELLQISWEEQHLEKSRLQYSGDEILVALRGGDIGAGTAPADLAVRYMNATHTLAFRAAECDAGMILRTKGPPPPEIQSFLQARATQPIAGSYRFSVRFVEPAQSALFVELKNRPDPRRVSRVVVEVLKTIEGADRAPFERLVPRPEYRLALTRLARNLVPGGTALTEVEVRTAEDDPDQAVRLHSTHRKKVNDTIKALLPIDLESESREETIVGILRGLSLDKSWLEIRSEGKMQRIETGPNELDDVIGPMVNRRVSARVRHPTIANRNKAPLPRLLDIDSLED